MLKSRINLTKVFLVLVFFTPQISLASLRESSTISVSITSITSPINRGNYATVKVKTAAEAKCTITVTYSSGKSKASGLEAKISNDNGRVSWTWKVGSSTKAGKYPVDISCKKDGKTGLDSIKINVKE